MYEKVNVYLIFWFIYCSKVPGWQSKIEKAKSTEFYFKALNKMVDNLISKYFKKFLCLMRLNLDLDKNFRMQLQKQNS